jgi:cobalamin biosynthesis Mg chelatase CobN
MRSARWSSGTPFAWHARKRGDARGNYTAGAAQVLRIEYRTKLLNPRWATAMAAQGSGGAYEISQRMTAMVGWGATAAFSEDWVWNQAADTYVLDDDMAATLRKNNPQVGGGFIPA